MSARTAAWLAWGIWFASALFAAAGLIFLALTWSVPVPDAWGFRGYQLPLGLAASTMGALVAARRPENAIGWLLSWIGLGTNLHLFFQQYATFAVLARPGIAGSEASAWLSAWVWVISAFPIGTLVPLTFPDGHLRSRRWRPVLWLTIAAIVMGAFTFATRPGPLENFPALDNPLAARGALGGAPQALQFLLAPLLLFCLVASSASLALRMRGASGDGRQQAKWLAYAVAIVAVTFTVMATDQVVACGYICPSGGPKGTQFAMVFAMSAVPVAIGVAILRYRLYDIDLLINRTLVYGAVSATLLATYALAVVLLQQLFRPLTTGNDVAIAASTLAVATLFQPVRRRIQDAVDRRFYRRKYDAQRTLSLFSGRLRQEVDLDTLSRELLGVVGETMQPTSATLWLRERKP